MKLYSASLYRFGSEIRVVSRTSAKAVKRVMEGFDQLYMMEYKFASMEETKKDRTFRLERELTEHMVIVDEIETDKIEIFEC